MIVVEHLPGDEIRFDALTRLIGRTAVVTVATPQGSYSRVAGVVEAVLQRDNSDASVCFRQRISQNWTADSTVTLEVLE